MPTKVELLRCAECGYTLTREKFEQICFDQCSCKDNYIGLIEDGTCPECCKEALEDIALEDVLAAWNNRADRNATIEECAKIVDGHVQLHRDNGLPTTYEPLEVAAKRIRALKEVS